MELLQILRVIEGFKMQGWSFGIPLFRTEVLDVFEASMGTQLIVGYGGSYEAARMHCIQKLLIFNNMTINNLVTCQMCGHDYHEKLVNMDGDLDVCNFCIKSRDKAIDVQGNVPMDNLGLPEFCFSTSGVTNEVILIKRGERGYYPYYDGSIKGKGEADRLNRELNVTRAQAQAMRIGSMCGWDAPGANPDMYDENGKAKKALNMIASVRTVTEPLLS